MVMTMRRTLLFRTLRGRLLLVAALATLPAFLFVVYVASNERRAALERAEAEARYVASLASREHAHQIAGARRLLDRLAGAAGGEKTVEHLSTLLPPMLSGFPQFVNLGVLTPSGDLAFSSVPPPGPVQMRENPAFREALARPGVAIGRYQIGQIVQRPILIMARAIRDRERPVLVLFAALDLEWLEELALGAGLPPDHELMIVDAAGSILASSRGRVEGEQRIAGFAKMRGADGLQEIERERAELLAVAAPLEGARELWVVVALPEAHVRGMANRVFSRNLMVLALLAVLTVLTSLLATDVSVLRDLRLLATATRRFGEGDLAARAPVPRPSGEIRDLALSFNEMAARLEQRDREATESHEQLRALTHRVQTAREEEAARIAQELHDQLGQELSVLKLELEMIRKLVTAADRQVADGVVRQVDVISERIDATVQTVRRLSSELRPGVLDRLGLTAGVEWLLREFERRSGISTHFTSSGKVDAVTSEVSTALFRITQEALTNVFRHAGATEVQTRLDVVGDELRLVIADDGEGFDPASAERKVSLGLLGMRERAARLGGNLEVESTPGGGTTLVIRIPTQEKSDEHEDPAGR
jgi:signal transduction histidine kinase